MKPNNTLYPSLAQIEQRLFSLDADILLRVARNDPTLPESFRLAVKNDAQQANALQALQEAPIDVQPPTAVSTSPLPPWILDMIQRKVAADALKLPLMPVAGLLVEVSHVITPPGARFLDWQLNSPLHVLLDRPSPDSDQVWLGWMVSPDASYAAWWDVVLEADDAPIDPVCGMVQLWNPIKLYWPMAKRHCGQLSATRMQVLRACAEEMLFSEKDPDVPPQPGHIGLRSVEMMPQMSLLSGTPLGEKNDPRRHYQTMYHRVRVALMEPARLACEQSESVRISTIARYWQQCVDWARQFGHSVVPQEPLSLALASEDNASYCFLFDDALRVTLSQEGIKTRLHLNNIHPGESLLIEHSLEAEIQDRILLKPEMSDSFLFDPALCHELRWRIGATGKWSEPLQLVGAAVS